MFDTTTAMYVYILFSRSLDKYYTGQTNDLNNRLERHNSGYEKYTRKGIPWELIWYKSCADRSEAVKLESKIKKRGAKRFLAEVDKN